MRAARREPGSARPSDLDAVFASVDTYYTGKLTRHGATPWGVDWDSQATQWLRFVQVLKICDFGAPFSLNDLGCGYGALAAFLDYRYPDARIDYLGIDLSRLMITRARRRHRGNAAKRFVVRRECPRQADYTVASGIMNVMLDHPRPLWESFLRATLADMHRGSLRGFAVNFLTATRSGSAAELLYCTGAEQWARFCETEFGCSVEILNDYGMPEFTLLVRRNDAPHPVEPPPAP